MWIHHLALHVLVHVRQALVVLQGTLHTEAFSLAGYELGSPLSGEAFGRMHALRILVLDGVEFGDVSVTQPLPKLAYLSWRYGKAARFPFALGAIRTAGVLILRGVDCLKPLLDGLQVCAQSLSCVPWAQCKMTIQGVRPPPKSPRVQPVDMGKHCGVSICWSSSAGVYGQCAWSCRS